MNMKKISAVILALVMVLSLTATAFAADALDDTQAPDKTHGVFGTYTPDTGSTTEDAYKVVITWKDMKFTFTVDSASSNKYVWSPDKLEFVLKDSTDTAVTGTWEANNTNTFTLENRSSKDVSVSATVTPESAAAGVTAAVTIGDNNTDIVNGTYTLPNAVGYTNNGPTYTGTVTLSGTPDLTKTLSNDKLFGLTLTLTHN